MKRLKPSSVEDLDCHSPVVWTSTGDDPGFVFEPDPRAGVFLCFFLVNASGELAPKITFDQGEGFGEVTALVLKSFPFAFYHFSLSRTREFARVRFRPCVGPATFRFLAFQTSNAILVAILHFLFNLRHQKIGIIAPRAKDAGSWRAAVGSNVARIVKFFGDVSKGEGVRVQEGAPESLSFLTLSLSLQAVAVQTRMDERLKDMDAPLISFVSPTYNTRPDYLRELLDSFTVQKAAYAELILSDDGSSDAMTLDNLRKAAGRPGVRVVFNAANRGIAATTNAGIAAARGRWIGFIDHDDLFVRGAIAVIADAIDRHPHALFFYTDELIVDMTLKPIGVFCKPAYDSVLLTGANYINHFSIFRSDRLAAIDGLREDREGSQDYDLLLRYLVEAKEGSVIHIPFLAYMWRREAGSYSTVHRDRAVANARCALASTCVREGHAVSVEPALDPMFHRIRFPSNGRLPLVSVIIPNRDNLWLIRRVVADLLERTAYAPMEIVIVDNGTTDRAVLDYYKRLESGHAKVTIDMVEEPFNFARMCNRGARLAEGDAFLFLNNDIEVGDSEWLAEMVECLNFDATGIVGAKLFYPNGKVQHNGVIVGLGNAAGHWYIEAEPDEPGPMGRFFIRQTLTAVTGACMLVTRRCLETLQGFDEENFAIAYNDIDLCIRARNAGFRTVWTPFAQLIHHESLTRGSDEAGEQNIRFREEMKRLQQRHDTETMIDDAYSPFYDRRDSRPHMFLPSTLPKLRPNVFR